MKRKNNSSAGRKVMGTLKWLVPLALIVWVLAMAFARKPVEVDLGTVTRGAMMLTIDDDGETRVRERFVISAPLAGRLLRIGLDAGDELKTGDTLATIDPGPSNLLDPRTRAQAKALVGAAEAAILRTQRQLDARTVEVDQLELTYNRNKTLRDKGNIADALFEQSEGAFLAARHAQEAAKSAVDMAKFDLEQAKAALLRTEPTGGEKTEPADWTFVIKSPIDGRVLHVHQESSRMVQPGTPLLDVGDPGEIELRIDVLSQDAVKIKPGQRVIVEHWGGDQALEARVRVVEPSAFTKVSALGVDEQRVFVIADLEADARELGDQFRIEARIVIWENDDALRVPAGALFRKGDSWAVYVSNGDRAQLKILEVGRNNGEVAEVLAGLNSDDRVILHPGDRVENGTLIKPR